jgi:hypothetical protein
MITTNLKYITQTFIDKYSIKFPHLVELDLLNFKNTNHKALDRIIYGCKKTLKVFKIHN